MRMVPNAAFRGPNVAVVEAHAAGACLRACEKLPDCAAFTFIRAAAAKKRGQPRCHLKKRRPSKFSPAAAHAAAEFLRRMRPERSVPEKGADFYAGAVSGFPIRGFQMGCTRVPRFNTSACPPGRGGEGCRFGRHSIRAYADHDPFANLTLRASSLDGWNVEPSVYAELSAGAELIVEVGVWRGASAAHLARSLKARAGGVLFAVDTWLGSVQFWTLSFSRGRHDPSRDLGLVNG